MKYVVLRTGGKQYRVSEGQTLLVEKLDKKPKEKFEFGEVLLWVEDGQKKVGQPLLKDIKAEGEVLEQVKGPKIRVAKFKAKVRYRRVHGHRQALTRVKIDKINAVREKSSKVEKTQK